MNRPTRFYSNRQEKKVAKALNGKRQSNSGATPFGKGDVTTDNWLIECKTVTKEQTTFSIKKEWLIKNKEEAFAMNKTYSAVAFDFGDNADVYYVISQKDFIKLLKNQVEEN